MLGVRDEQRKNRGKARTKAWKEKKRGKNNGPSFVVLLLYIKKYVGRWRWCGIVEGGQDQGGVCVCDNQRRAKWKEKNMEP